MKRTVLFLLVAAVSSLARADAASPAAPIVPMELPTQGYLLDSTNKPVTQQGLKITFSLYSSDTSPTAIWQESDTVDVVNGYYALELGQVAPLSAESLATPLFLGVAIDGGQELQPRLQVGSVPFALEAELAHDLAGGTITGATITNSSVDATQVSIDGTPVIDSSGQFLGTAHDAENLGGVPAASYLSSNGGDGSKLSNLNPAALSPGTASIDITGNAATATTAQDFSGSLSGDVTGTEHATVVSGLEGVSVSSAAPNATDVLRFDAATSSWSPSLDASSFNGRTGDIVPQPGDYSFDLIAGQATDSQLEGPLVTALTGGNGLTVTTTNPTGVDRASLALKLDGSTLANGASGLSVNLGNANTWTGAQAFSSGATFGAGAKFSTSTGDALDVTSADGNTKYLAVGSTGALTISGPATFNGGISASTFTGNVSGTASNVTGTVAVVNGGTGVSSVGSGRLLIGAGTSPLGSIAAPLQADQVLRSSGAGTNFGWGSLTVGDLPTGIPNANLAHSTITIDTPNTSGLTGGSSTPVSLGGGLSLSIASGGVTNSMLANPSLTITAGQGLTGGGTPALGGNATLAANLNRDATLVGNGGSSSLGLDLTHANNWTAAQTFSGSATVSTTGNTTSLTVDQTSHASPTADVLDVNSSGGATKYFTIDYAGNATFSGTVNASQFVGSTATGVSVNAPLTGDGTTGSRITIPQANGSTDGYLAQGDWTTFNSKAASGANHDITSLTGLTTALPVSEGGTGGSAAPTAGAVAYGIGSRYAFSVAGASGELLVSGGAGAPTWGQLASMETDPIFTASAADGITSGNITNWNTAYTDRMEWNGGSTGLNATTGRASLGLGALATESAVTFGQLPSGGCTNGQVLKWNGSTWACATETDPVFAASAASGITSTDINNWNAAYGNDLEWNGGSTGLNAANGRTSLGLGSLATKSSIAASDITQSGCTNGQMLKWNGSTWACAAETDPVFTASPADGIAGTDITNWNTAYGHDLEWNGGSTNLNAATGRTSLGLGSLATKSSVAASDIAQSGCTNSQMLEWNGSAWACATETDPVFTASAAHGITSPDITSWNGKLDAAGGTMTGALTLGPGGGTVPLTVNPSTTPSVDLTDWQVGGSTVASVSSAGDLHTNGVVGFGESQLKLQVWEAATTVSLTTCTGATGACGNGYCLGAYDGSAIPVQKSCTSASAKYCICVGSP